MKSKLPIPSEDYEQECLVNWWDNTYPELLMFAIPNGGFRHIATAIKLKKTGLRKGIPDLYIPHLKLWVEMKRVKGGRLSPDQKTVITYLKSIGDSVEVCEGYLHAKEVINEFMQAK